MAPVEFAYDYNQLYLYDAAQDFAGTDNPYLGALDAATQAGLTVGAACGVVDVLMPRQDNFSATIDVAIVDSPPPPQLVGSSHTRRIWRRRRPHSRRSSRPVPCSP